MSAVNIAGATNTGRLSAMEAGAGQGLGCAADAAERNTMENGRVLVGNYCGSLAGRVTAN